MTRIIIQLALLLGCVPCSELAFGENAEVKANSFGQLLGEQIQQPSLRQTVNEYELVLFAEFVEEIRINKKTNRQLRRFLVTDHLGEQSHREEQRNSVIVIDHQRRELGETVLLLMIPKRKDATQDKAIEMEGHFVCLVKNGELSVQEAMKVVALAEELSRPQEELHQVHKDGLWPSFADQFRIMPMTEDRYEYLETVFQEANPPQRRLANALHFLDSDDAVIAADAFCQIQETDFETLLTLSNHIPSAAMRKLYRNKTMPMDVRSYALLLLGISGDTSELNADSDAFSELIANNYPSLPTAIIGLLLLKPAGGVATLQREFFENESAFTKVSATFDALTFFRRCIPSYLDRNAVDQLLLKALSGNSTAREAIDWLREGEDWRFVDQIRDAYTINVVNLKPESLRLVEQINFSVIYYLRACAEFGSADRAGASSTAIQAAELLKTLRELDQPFVTRMEPCVTAMLKADRVGLKILR